MDLGVNAMKDTARVSLGLSIRTLALLRIIGQIIIIGGNALVLWSLAQEFRIQYG